MSTALRINSVPGGPLMVALVVALSLVFAVSIFFLEGLSVLALVGLIVFVFFARYPMLGLYATVAALLLQGSTGVLGAVNSAGLAITFGQIAGAAALSAWGINVLVGKTPVRINMPILFLGGFCAWALLGTLLSPDAGQELPHWVRLVFRTVLLFLAVNTVNTPKKMHWYIVVLLLCGLLMSFSAVLQYVLPDLQVAGATEWAVSDRDVAYVDQESLQGEAAIRVSGRAGHSNWLAMIILLILPLNAYWFHVAKHVPMKLLILFAVGIQMVTLALTYTRTGFLIGVVLIALILTNRIIRITPQRVIAGVLLLVVGFAMLPGAYKERVFNPKQYARSNSVESRLELQQAAARYGAQNPLVGLGAGGFGLEFVHENNETAQVMNLLVRTQGWDPVFIGTHNMYLQLLADSGFPGLILFLIFFVVMLRRLYRMQQRYRKEGDETGDMLATSLFISLIGFALTAVFLHALHQEIWYMVAAAALAVSIHQFRFDTPETTPDFAGEAT